MSANTKLIEQFLDYLWLSQSLSANTLSSYGSDLKIFNNYLANNTLREVDEQLVLNYLTYRNKKETISATTKARIIATLRRFYQYLLERSLVKHNPCKHISTGYLRKKLPDSLSVDEVEMILTAPNANTNLGSRDCAMLELLYACGMRVSELVTLEQKQIDLHNEFIILKGKGNKERILPLHDLALKKLKNYQQQARPQLLKKQKFRLFFI